MTRTGIGCGLGKTLQQEPNARGITRSFSFGEVVAILRIDMKWLRLTATPTAA